MAGTITVKGTGNVTVKPDYITISLSLDAVNISYEDTAALASHQLESLTEAVEKAGFCKNCVKTADFRIFTEYESVMDKNGSYRNKFAGYHCSHKLKIGFDFDTKRLSDILAAISACDTQPELNISFTVKDTDAVCEEVLRSAAENARKKAEILCSASGAQLGPLQSIDYHWNDTGLVSNTRYGMEDCLKAQVLCSARSMDFQPEDIRASDTAVFVWELV